MNAQAQGYRCVARPGMEVEGILDARMQWRRLRV
jgi:hypothetical protein